MSKRPTERNRRTLKPRQRLNAASKSGAAQAGAASEAAMRPRMSSAWRSGAVRLASETKAVLIDPRGYRVWIARSTRSILRASNGQARFSAGAGEHPDA